jgi:Flp pilus assembly pilin Flp
MRALQAAVSVSARPGEASQRTVSATFSPKVENLVEILNSFSPCNRVASGASPVCILEVTNLEDLTVGKVRPKLSCAGAQILVRVRVLTSVKTPPPAGKVRSAMQQLLNCLRKIWNDDQGQDIAEYALMLTVILLVVVGAVTSIGSHANTIFNTVASQLSAS